MESAKSNNAKAKVSGPEKSQLVLHWSLTIVLGLVFAAELVLPQRWPLLDAALIVLAAIVSVTALNRQMPLQNVLLAATITAVLGGVAHGLSSDLRLGLAMPFGPLYFREASGAKIFGFVPWTIPLLWVAALFSARGTARVIVRPWRKLKSYGYWIIGLTAVLIVAFDFALEPFAVRANAFWSWQTTKFAFTWYDASPLNFLGWGVVALLILAFATPTLIKKQPGSRSAVDLNPLCLWLGGMTLFALGAAKASLWPAVGADAVMAIIVLVFAIRGARW
ncbi:MAG TPA: carotenoid biosynthesis protein [Verrucomicrobiae bacterium]|jgi:uncharacterized membrane protein